MLVLGLVIQDVLIILIETVFANTLRAVDTDEDHRVVTTSHLK